MPAITKEVLTARIAQLEAQLVQVQANGNALAGAIQLSKQLLTDLEAPEAKELKSE